MGTTPILPKQAAHTGCLLNLIHLVPHPRQCTMTAQTTPHTHSGPHSIRLCTGPGSAPDETRSRLHGRNRQVRQLRTIEAATLDAALLRRAAAIVGDRSNIGNRHHRQPGCLDRTDRAFAPRSGTLDKDIYLAHVKVTPCALGYALSRQLRGKRRRLAAALKTGAAAARPTKRVALRVRNGHNRIVKRRMDMRLPMRDVLALAS